MADVMQPHDKLFKGLLDQPGTAGALIRERLPEDIRALLTDDPPELEPGEYVDEALRGSHLVPAQEHGLAAGSSSVQEQLQHGLG